MNSLTCCLVIAVCTLLCGGSGFDDMADFGRAKHQWFKTFLTLRHGIPSHDTFNRVFAALKPEAFLDCFLRWTQSLRQAVAQEIVALDGKALRRAVRRGQSPRYIISAWAQGNGLVLGQFKVADKSNEITALPHLLRVLELAGCIVTVDAMGCQKTLAKEITKPTPTTCWPSRATKRPSMRRCRVIWMTPSSSRRKRSPGKPRGSRNQALRSPCEQ